MNKNIFLLLILSITIITSSCSTVIDIDQKEFNKRLVLTSTLDPDSTISVYVTRSVGSLATGLPDSITNAIVDFYEDGNLLFTVPYYSYGNYNYNYNPIVGKKYRITVSVPGFDNIEASTYIPTIAIVDTFSAVSVPSTNQFGADELQGSVTINDPPGENYYMIQLTESYLDTFMNIEYPNIIYLTSDDPIIGSSNQSSASLLFSDFAFDGTSYVVRFKSDYFMGNSGGTNLFYKVYSLSKESYLYLTSLKSYYDNNGNPFSEPVQVYSNVSSQMGILGAVSKWEVQVY